jgi:hypothetical protein
MSLEHFAYSARKEEIAEKKKSDVMGLYQGHRRQL